MYSSFYNRFLKFLYPSLIWRIPSENNEIFLTFDDGPVPEVTPFVLDELDKHQARATFFCVGKNAQANPELINRILSAGHRIGNHTYHHLNGWVTDDKLYFESIEQARSLMAGTDLFRPPYGKIRKSQIRQLKNRYRIVMWNVLSYDFDKRISPEKCLSNVLDHADRGSIIVFHDSLKAFPNLKYALPRSLEQLSARGFRFSAIP